MLAALLIVAAVAIFVLMPGKVVVVAVAAFCLMIDICSPIARAHPSSNWIDIEAFR
jgi:hypothetical protein